MAESVPVTAGPPGARMTKRMVEASAEAECSRVSGIAGPHGDEQKFHRGEPASGVRS